jgi:Tfp pilus assembly protein PilF
MKSNLSKAESWIKSKLTGFTGAQLDYHNEYFFDPLDFVAEKSDNHSYAKDFYQATGVKGYYYNAMRFFAYYCYDNKLPIHTEVESGSSVKVIFNNVFASDLCTDVGVFTVNGKFAFTKFEKSRSEGRIDFYDLRAKRTDDAIYTSYRDIMLIRNSDKPVFIPITRQEYLEQMLQDIQVYKTRRKDFLTSFQETSRKDFEKEMAVYKASDKSYTPEKEAKRRKWFNEDMNPEKLAKDLKKLEDEVNGARQIITEYLGKPQEWLSRGFSSFYPWSFESYAPQGIQKYFDNLDVFAESREDLTRTEAVSINPAYFNKGLSRDVPQLISVVVVKGRYPHMLKVSELIKQAGALAPLEAIINPGKTAMPEPGAPALISSYTLRYLPKLTRLTPLIVPADMKPSGIPFVNNYNSNGPAAKFNFVMPALSPKLSQLPAPLTTESYKAYTQALYTAISDSMQPNEKKKADDYLKNKKQTQSTDISKTALAAWLQNAPRASLYLYSKAVVANSSDALAANNFAAFLMMAGLPEKSIPLLEYWNRQKPGEATILANLGNAYYRLGDVDKATKYSQQCVQYDTLNAMANKMLCLMALKKGDTKKAADHGTKSLATSYDEQVIAILRQLDNKVRPGEIMSQLPEREFPLLKRIKLPAMPSSLEDMDNFVIDIEAEKKSIDLTIANIEAKVPNVSQGVQQKMMMAGLSKGISTLQVKAQFIIMDAMQIYQQEMVREYDVFKYHVAKLTAPHNLKVKAISKKYGDQLNKLEGGEAGDEDKISALELARCKEINAEKEKYLAALSPLVNGYAQRLEYVSRKFYREYANWAPYWMPATTISFPSIERDYLKDISNILGECLNRCVQKTNCAAFEPLEKKEGVLKEWEDAYCANFKGKIGMGPAKITWTCNSWGIEGGEGWVGEFEVSYENDGSFKEFTLGAGVGATMHLGEGELVKVEGGASVKEFIKIGRDKATGEWKVNDFGLKSEVSLEAGVGKASVEAKIIEVSVAVNAGVEVGGAVAPLLKLD